MSSMNVKIQPRNLEISPDLKKLIEKRSRKTRKVLPTFAPQDLDLHVTIEKLPRKKQYRSALVLTLPQSAFRVEDVEDSPKSSLLRAFDELSRRIEKFKSQLNRERFWKRAEVAAAPAADDGEQLREIIRQRMEKVENYVRRELLHEMLVENLPPGLLEPQALVDEVFLEASARVREKPEEMRVEHWLFQMARAKLRQRIHALQEAREQPHLEERVRLSSQWEDEALHFYQPDEELRMEDLLADEKSITPEESLAREEAEQQLRKAIAGLPKPVREAFILHVLEDFAFDEVAMITGVAPQQVKDHVEEARARLRELFRRPL